MEESKQVAQTDVFINKDMFIGEVAQQYPQVVDVFLHYGLHCIGCHVSPYETIEQGASGHGMDEKTITMMIEDANKAIKENPVAVHEHSSVDLSKADLTVTEVAIKKLKEIMKQEKKENHFFRIAVMPGGCSGFSYHFDLDEKAFEDDIVKEKDGLKIAIDPGSMEMMNGATVDYVETLQASGFKVENPNAKASCGCGHSFS